MVRPLAEGALLALAGGAAALLVAHWAGNAIRRLFLGVSDAAGLAFHDGRTVVFTLVLTAFVGIAVGGIPAALSGRGDLSGIFRGGSSGGRMRTGLLIVQLALSAVLLVGAALFVRSLNAVRDMRMGYDADRLARISRVIEPGAFEAETPWASASASASPMRRASLSSASPRTSCRAASSRRSDSTSTWPSSSTRTGVVGERHDGAAARRHGGSRGRARRTAA